MKQLIIILLFFFSSCTYKDYIMLSDDYSTGVYNRDKTQFSFFKFYRISKPAKGLAAFPDGGQSKVLYEGAFVYLYDIPTNKLSLVYSFDGLKGSSTKWNVWTDFDNKNQLFFNISLPLRYKSYATINNNIYKQHKGLYLYNIENKKVSKVSEIVETPRFSADKQKIIYTSYVSGKSEIYMMDKNAENVKFKDNGFNLKLSTKSNYLAYIYESDSALYDLKIMNFIDNSILKIKTIKNINKYSIYWQDNNYLCFNDEDGTHKKYDIVSKLITDNSEKRSTINDKEISANEIKKRTKDIRYPEWGINVQKYCPKSKKEILESIVNTDKGNEKYRIALLQEVGNQLSINDINNLLRIIDEHTNELTSYKKSYYERNIQETVEYLKKIQSIKK